MKKKIDPLFALSVLVLVLGIFALACSWIPFQGQCTVSANVAKAETVSAGGISNTDFVIGTTTEAKYWRSATPLVNGGYYNSNVIGYMVKGLPKVSDFSAMTWSSPFMYEVIIRFSGLVNGISHTVSSTLSFTNNFMEQSITAFSLDLIGSNDDLDMNIYTDHVFTGESEMVAQFCNKSFSSRFCVFDYPSPVTVSYTFKDTGVEVTSETMTDNFRQFLSIVNDLVAFSPVDFASYGDYLLNNQGGGDPDLQAKYDDLKKNYDNLFNSVSFSRVVSGFPSDSFYTTKHLDAVSYNGSAVTVESGGIVTFGGKVISSSDGFVSVSYTPTQSELLVPYFKFMAFKLPSDYEYATAFVLQNVSFTYGPVYVGYADLVASYTFDTQVSSVGMLDNVIELGQLEEGKNFYFNLPKAATNQSVLLFYSNNDFGVSTSMVLSQVTPINDKVYEAGFVAGQDSMLGAIENARQQGFSEAQKMFDNGNTDYSFFGLISAVIDAPIKAIRGLLNFDILGVNMFAFVTSLFSLAVILMLIKFILGTRGV